MTISRIPLTAPRHEKGQSTVEFAFVFPVFLGVLIGLASFALLFYSYLTMQLAVRQGASALVHDPTHETVADIQNIVISNSFSLNASSLNVVVAPSDTSQWVSGAPVSVSASYTVPIPTVSIPMIGSGRVVLLGPIPISAVSVMTIE